MNYYNTITILKLDISEYSSKDDRCCFLSSGGCQLYLPLTPYAYLTIAPTFAVLIFDVHT